MAPSTRHETVEVDGTRLRALRRERRLSQEKLLANPSAPGITRGYISIIETRPRYRVSRSTATQLARALGVELADLVCADEAAESERQQQAERPPEALMPLPPASLPPLEQLARFSAGPPILHPAQFFGRVREIDQLFRLWSNRPRQHAAVLGPRRSGKTSLLRHLRALVSAPDGALRPGQHRPSVAAGGEPRFVYVDFQDPRLRKQEGLLRYLLSALDLPVPDICDLDRSLEVLERGITAPTVLLFDELDAAVGPSSELNDSTWETFRSAANNASIAGNLAFVIASPAAPAVLGSSQGFGSPFFNMFGHAYELGPFEEAEARELIGNSAIPFSPSDVDWILEQSGCWPFRLQLLSAALLEALESGDPTDRWRELALTQLARLE